MEKRRKQFLLFSTIFCHLLLSFLIKTRTRFLLQDTRLFKISEVEIMGVHCVSMYRKRPNPFSLNIGTLYNTCLKIGTSPFYYMLICLKAATCDKQCTPWSDASLHHNTNLKTLIVFTETEISCAQMALN